MHAPIASLDDHAADLLEASSTWELVTRFERSLLLSRIADGAMVSLVRNDVPDGPYTARLTGSCPSDLRAWGATPVLDVRRAARWSPRLVPAGEAVDQEELEQRLDTLDTAAARSVRTSGGGAEAVIPAAELEALETALAADDPMGAADVAVRIAGLGPGLTPSGDDVLAGALAFHAWAEAAGFVARGGEGLREAVRDAAAPRTTRVSAQLLQAAVRGHVAAPLAALLTAIFARRAAFAPDLSAVLAIGATSGGDMLAGVRVAGRAVRRCTHDHHG